MADTTTKYGLPYPEGAVDFVKDGATAIQNLAEDVDSKFPGYSEGPLGSRPTSTPGTPGIAGRIYRATEPVSGIDTYYIDHGTGWNRLVRVVGVGTATWNPASIAHGAAALTTVTVSTAAPGDLVLCAFPNAAGVGVILTGQAGIGLVNVVLANVSGSAVDLASGTLTAMVLRI